jgi:hypothetical protein
MTSATDVLIHGAGDSGWTYNSPPHPPSAAFGTTARSVHRIVTTRTSAPIRDRGIDASWRHPTSSRHGLRLSDR